MYTDSNTNQQRVHNMTYSLPTKTDIKNSILEHGCDSELLYAISERDLAKLFPEDDIIFTHWDNCQEEMKCLLADARSEFGY